jgi:hypothetical protein
MVHVDDSQPLARAVPLLDKTVHIGLKWHTQGLEEGGAGRVGGAAEGQAESELVAVRQVDLSRQGDISVHRAVVFPIHLQVVRQVGPTVTDTNVAAGELAEPYLGSDRHVYIVAIGNQEMPALRFQYFCIVVPSANVQMGAQST